MSNNLSQIETFTCVMHPNKNRHLGRLDFQKFDLLEVLDETPVFKPRLFIRPHDLAQ